MSNLLCCVPSRRDTGLAVRAGSYRQPPDGSVLSAAAANGASAKAAKLNSLNNLLATAEADYLTNPKSALAGRLASLVLFGTLRLTVLGEYAFNYQGNYCQNSTAQASQQQQDDLAVSLWTKQTCIRDTCLTWF